jgi:CheY-like chemotaxis protein
MRSTCEVENAVVFGDSTQLHQVVMNLCANAEYAMRSEGGLLEVRLTAVELTPISVVEFPSLTPGAYLQLTIGDTGQGIPAQTLEHIFEPFFTTKGKGEGTGLGLSVVHGVVIGHGGHIAVSSTKGQGTTFTILLPRLDVVLSPHPQQMIGWPKGSGRILFVDDEEMLARWGEQLLTQLGYTVVTKTNPHDALTLFRKEADQFDLVVTDQTMPTMSGEAFARALLAIRQDVPIILCTGFSHTITAEKAAYFGFRAFLMKPVNGTALAHTIKKVMTAKDPHANQT